MSTRHSNLWQHIQASGIHTLAVVGMCKNTGKTVVLNHVLAQAHGAKVPVGVSSIGRDGEDRDAVFMIPKPAIMVWPGSLVATARATLEHAKARYQLIEATGIDSPMGEIVLVKTLSQGEMEVAGASRSSDQLKVISRLKLLGADLVLLDGALGRSHHASPAIADGVILATGAALGGAMEDVLRKTRERLALLGIAPADAALCQLCEPVLSAGAVGLWDSQAKPLLAAQIPTLNAANTLLQHLHEDVKTIALSGALGRSVWQALLVLARSKLGLTVVVNDGTRLFVQASDLELFTRLGARLYAYRAIRVIGLTVNPYSPTSTGFNAQAFLAAAQQALPHYDVSDVMLEATIKQHKEMA